MMKSVVISDNCTYFFWVKNGYKFTSFFITQSLQYIKEIICSVYMSLDKGKSKKICENIFVLIREKVKNFIYICSVCKK